MLTCRARRDAWHNVSKPKADGCRNAACRLVAHFDLPLARIATAVFESLSFSTLRNRLCEFDTVIDVRSPAEYADDHVQGAINCPVLDDEQRVQVGTAYRQASPFDARKLGAALVARNIADHIEHRFSTEPKSWRPLVYCWRGGERSAALAHVLSRIGWRTVQLLGGYKGYRRTVLDELATLPARLDFRVLCGPTGSGKSHLLAALAGCGAQIIDLEGLAAHRGSVLGVLPDEIVQPSQRRFESLLWNALGEIDPRRAVYVESESRKIGDLHVPSALIEAMRASACIVLEMDFNTRVSSLLHDYAHLIAAPEALRTRLGYLTMLHGRQRIAQWNGLIEDARWGDLVESLLALHYDAAYRRSTHENFGKIGQAQRVALSSADAESFNAAAVSIIENRTG